jgi:hypothetical protein
MPSQAFQSGQVDLADTSEACALSYAVSMRIRSAVRTCRAGFRTIDLTRRPLNVTIAISVINAILGHVSALASPLSEARSF